MSPKHRRARASTTELDDEERTVSACRRGVRARARRALVALLGLAISWPLAGVARASVADHVDLHYSAPDGCPDRADVLGAIEHQVGADFATDTQLRAVATVSVHAAGEYELAIEYRTSSGAHDERRIQSESCRSAADAIAWLLSLALVPRPPPPPSAAAEPNDHTEIALLVAGDSGMLPRFAVGGGLQLGFSFGALRLDLSAFEWAPQDLQVRDEVGAQFDLWTLAVGACYIVGWPAIRLGPCARAEVGRLAGSAFGIDSARPGSARVQALALGGQLRLRVISPVWLLFDLGAEWIERRPAFVVADYGPLFQSARFGVRLGFGPLLIW